LEERNGSDGRAESDGRDKRLGCERVEQTNKLTSTVHVCRFKMNLHSR